MKKGVGLFSRVGLFSEIRYSTRKVPHDGLMFGCIRTILYCIHELSLLQLKCQCGTGHSITTVEILFAIDTFATSMDQHATTPLQTWILKQPTTLEYRQLMLTTREAPSHL